MIKYKNSFRKILLFLFLLIASTRLDAQTVLLHVDRASDSIPSKFGPNLHSYAYPYFRFGFVCGDNNPGAKIKYGTSVALAFGVRVKYKLGKIYSTGWDFGFYYHAFKMVQDSGKIVPNNYQNKTERLDFSSLRVAWFNRINFDPYRGNILGRYLDLGLAGEWNYSVMNILKNDFPDGSKAKTAIKKQPYYTDLNAYAEAKFGINRFAFYGTYRLTDLFRPRYNFPELPPLVIGIELALGVN